MRVAASSIFQVTTETLTEIDDYIRDLEQVGRNFPLGMEALAQLLARADKGFSQELSRGPVDPLQNNPGAAWKIPVRRITSRYYFGWKLQRVAPGVWRVYNDTREAWYIEYGIHTSTRRVIRPVRKRALLMTLKFADQTRVGERVWEMIYGPMRIGGSGRERGLGSRARAVNFSD